MNLSAATALARGGRLYPSVVLHGGAAAQRRAAALELARTLLCEAAPEGRPCDRCRHCSRIVWPGGDLDGFHPDFRVLERDLKTATSVGATKAFLQLAQVAPFEARGQVFVIADAESLTGEAANALLKTLEEPPVRTPRNFLLLTPSQLDLLPTIRSRSAALFLGSEEQVDREEVLQLAERFSAHVGDFFGSGTGLALVLAAEQLVDAGSWQDPRSTRPWTTAAAAVMESCERIPNADRRRLLALAEELLTGWRLRLRGIQAQRIIEGMVVKHLAR